MDGLNYILWLTRERFRQRSYLVPGHGARVRYSLGTNVNTPFFQVPTLEFGHSAGAWLQGLNSVLGHKSGHQLPVWTQFFVLAAKLMFQNGVWQGEME